MKKLCQYVVNKVASKWDILGYALLDENQSTKINTIKSNFQDSEKCCVELFDYWWETHPNINWHDLVTALNTTNLQSVAADLEKMFIGTYVCFKYLNCCIMVQYVFISWHNHAYAFYDTLWAK